MTDSCGPYEAQSVVGSTHTYDRGIWIGILVQSDLSLDNYSISVVSS